MTGLPLPTQRLTDGDKINPYWLRWLQRLSASILTREDVQGIVDATIAAMPVASPPIITGGGGVTVTPDGNGGYIVEVPGAGSSEADAGGQFVGGYVGIPYSNCGAFGDPWRDLGNGTHNAYRYVSGDFWPGATVNHTGQSNTLDWVNEVCGIPLTAGSYSITARVEVDSGYHDHTQTVVIAAKPSFALWDFSGRTYSGITHTGESPAFSGVELVNAGILDCAGWTSGKVYCEMYVTDEDGDLSIGVHGASLANKYLGNPNTLAEFATTGVQYALAFDTATGSLWVRNASGWIGGGDPAAGTSPTRTGLTASVNGRFRFGASGRRGTVKANFGNEAWAYAIPAGFAGVPMGTVTVPAMWDSQSLPIGTRVRIGQTQGQRYSSVVGSLFADLEWLAIATVGKSSGKWQFELTNPRLADDQRVGLCTSAFVRANGLLGQPGTQNSIGVRNRVLTDANILIETCFGGVHTQYLTAASAQASIFTFAADLTAGTVAVYADGVLLQTITGVPAGTYYPACTAGFSGGSDMTSIGLAFPVATYSEWTVTV